jgi:integrase
VKLNETTISALPTPASGNKLYFFSGAVVQGATVPRGFAVRVTKDGARSFVMDCRDGPRQRRYTIGRWPDWSALVAVREARELRQRIDRGDDPLGERRAAAKPLPEPEPEPVKTVAAVLDEFVRGHVEKRLRQPKNYTQAFERLVKPMLGSRPIYEVRRSHVAEMLDRIEDENGPIMANRTVSYLASALNWYAGRDDDYTPPRLSKLKRASQARDRVLTDDEIRAIWRVAEVNGVFGAVVRFLLLTGQRRGDVYGMTWAELDKDVWTIPARRYKTGKAHSIPLSKSALAIVMAQPHGPDLVFPGRSGIPLSTGGRRKLTLDAVITEANGKPLPHWTLHDLRRTARTLMSRVGVRPDVAERVVGHVIRGVAGVYDRHTYEEEKRDALEKLAGMIERIIHPDGANVVPLRQEVK